MMPMKYIIILLQSSHQTFNIFFVCFTDKIGLSIIIVMWLLLIFLSRGYYFKHYRDW